MDGLLTLKLDNSLLLIYVFNVLLVKKKKKTPKKINDIIPLKKFPTAIMDIEQDYQIFLKDNNPKSIPVMCADVL